MIAVQLGTAFGYSYIMADQCIVDLHKGFIFKEI